MKSVKYIYINCKKLKSKKVRIKRKIILQTKNATNKLQF